MDDASRGFVERFCRTAVGPLVAAHLAWVDARVPRGRPVALLSREGHALADVRAELVARGALPPRRAFYLPGSRAFLLRAGLDDPRVLDVAVSIPFLGGTECDFLRGRLALPACPLCAHGAHTPGVLLAGPVDPTRLRRLLLMAAGVLGGSVADDRAAYRRLVASAAGGGGPGGGGPGGGAGGPGGDGAGGAGGGGGPLTVVDIGFTGTIPRLLHRLLGRPVTALLLVRCAPAGPGPGRRPVAGHDGVDVLGLLGPFARGAGEAVLDRSLPLEAVLTAPFGQLVGVRGAGPGGPADRVGAPGADGLPGGDGAAEDAGAAGAAGAAGPVYAPTSLSPEHLALLPTMHRWVADGAEDALAAFGPHLLRRRTLDLLRGAYATFAVSTLWPHDAATLLTVEDAISGVPRSGLRIQAHAPS